MTSTIVIANIGVMDCGIDAMLRKSQPRNFSGKGKQLEEWIEKMEDYFDLAQSTSESKAMIAGVKLEKSAKLWWKDYCIENSIDTQIAIWPFIKDKLKKNYQNKTYMVECVNEFLDWHQGTKDLEGYYQHFFDLIKVCTSRNYSRS